MENLKMEPDMNRRSSEMLKSVYRNCVDWFLRFWVNMISVSTYVIIGLIVIVSTPGYPKIDVEPDLSFLVIDPICDLEIFIFLFVFSLAAVWIMRIKKNERELMEKTAYSRGFESHDMETNHTDMTITKLRSNYNVDSILHILNVGIGTYSAFCISYSLLEVASGDRSACTG